MVVIWFVLRWAPLAIGLWALSNSVSTTALALVAVLALLAPRRWILAGAAAAVGLWVLHAPVSWVVAAACYRLVYITPLRWAQRLANLPQARRIQLSPRFRCSHGRRNSVREADSCLRSGRSAEALDRYLRILAAHPRQGGCDRVLLVRAAEAAVESHCPQIGAELAAAAAFGVGDTPIGAEAVTTARAHALSARAQLALGQVDAASSELRRAQGVTHRNRRADRLVRGVAAETHLAARQLRDFEGATEAFTAMLVRHRLSPTKAQFTAPLFMAAGRALLAEGRPAEARKAFVRAADATGVGDRVDWLTLVARARQRLGWKPGWHPAVRDWAQALCESAHCTAVLGEKTEVGIRAYCTQAAEIAADFGDTETAARAAACRAYLDQLGNRTSPVWTLPVTVPEHAPFLLADFEAQRRQRLLQQGVQGIHLLYAHGPRREEEDRTASGPLPWTVGDGTGSGLQQVVDDALTLFGQLEASAPRIFGPMRSRTRSTAARLGLGPVDEPAAPSVLNVTHTWNRPVAHSPRKVSAHTHAPAPAPASAHTHAHASASASASMEPLTSPELPIPDWLTEADQLTRGRCWTVLAAALQARELGHGRVGTEHLLLTVCQDATCGALLRLFGTDYASVRACLTALSAADPEAPAAVALTGRAREVLLLARTEADRQHSTRLDPTHLLTAIILNGKGVGAHVLAALGVDLPEALIRLRLGRAATDLGVQHPPFPLIGELRDPQRLTPPVRQVLTRAAEYADATRTGLVGDTQIRRAIAAEGWGPGTSHPLQSEEVEGTAVESGRIVRLTPRARGMLRRAAAHAEHAEHPGVDLDHLRAAADGAQPEQTARRRGAEAMIGAAQRAAVRLGLPFVGPEHLVLALSAVERSQGQVPDADSPWSGPPLPLTPQCKAAVKRAQACACAAGRAECSQDDLRQALAHDARSIGARLLTAPNNAARTAPPPLVASTRRHRPGGVQDPGGLVRALEEISNAVATTLDVRRVREARMERVEVLRILHQHHPQRFEDQLTRELIDAAQLNGRSATATDLLDEAARRTREAIGPSPANVVDLARTLARISHSYHLLGLDEAALAVLDEADGYLLARVEHGRDTEDASDLHGRLLSERAEYLRGLGSPQEGPALLTAVNALRALVTDGQRQHRTNYHQLLHRALPRLEELDRHEDVVTAATDALTAVDWPAQDLGETHFRRARALWWLCRGDLGRADLDAAVESAPDNTLYLTRRGTLLLRLGHLDEALADLNRCLEKSPLNGLARYRRGQCQLLLAQYEAALSDLDAALTDLPPDPGSLVARAQAYRSLDQPDLALRDASAASAAEPDTAWYRYQYALSLHAVGSASHARRQLGEAIRLETRDCQPTNPWRFAAAGNLAVYHAALSAERQSRAWINRALTCPHHPWMASAIQVDLSELGRVMPTLADLCNSLAVGLME